MMFDDDGDESGNWPRNGGAVIALADAPGRIALDERPTLLIVGTGERAAAMALWAERAGLRCVGRVGIEAAAERLARTVSLDLILLDLRGLDVPLRLCRATARALAMRYGLAQTRMAVLTDLAGLDCALASLDAPGSEFLCEPADHEIVSLLVMAGLRPSTSAAMLLHDASRDSDMTRLEQLSEEVRRLAVTIEKMTLNGAVHGAAAGAVLERRGAYRGGAAEAPARLAEPRERHRGAEPTDDAPATHAEIRAMIRARRMREQFLPADLFADPAWDMILDLMAARLAGQRVSVSSLCIAAAVPPTTALRWIRQLTERAVFARIDDPVDGRRVFIELSDAAAQAVTGWVQAVRRNGILLAGGAR